jgi:hypothetical protein
MALSGYGADNAGYAQQASDLQYRYNTDKAQNAYGRFLSQQRGSRNLGDMQRNFGQGFGGYKAQFGQRGLAGPGVRSGAMQRSMGNMLGGYNRDYSRAQQDLTGELQQFDMEGANLDAHYNNSLAALEQQKQQDIANAALAIEALRPLLGGL